jgi:hypothetical protein
VATVLADLPSHYTGPVLAIAGHSQGGSVVFFQALQSPQTSPPLLINVSGRYDAKGTEGRFSAEQRAAMENGPLPWIQYPRGPVDRRYKETYYVSKEKLQSYLDTVMDEVSELSEKFSVLTIHGRGKRGPSVP